MVCCVLLSFSAKAQQAFSPFPKAKDKYWQKQVLWRCATTISGWVISIGTSLGMPFLTRCLPSTEPMVTAPDTRRRALASESSLSVW